MGIFSEIGKAVSGSKLWQKATEVAKTVKKVATDVTQAIAGKEGIVAQAYGKLKSWGSMALGMVFPNMEQETLTSLQSVTSSSVEAGGPQFAGTFGNSLKAASSGTVAPSSTITDQIRTGLKTVNPDTSKATQGIYDSTMEYIEKGPSKVTDAGKWVIDKAKSTIGLNTSTTPVSGFVTSDQLYDPYSPLGVSNLVGKPAIPMDITKQPLNVQYKAAEDLSQLTNKAGKPLYDMDILDKSRELGVSPFSGVVESIKKSGQPEFGLPTVGLSMANQPQSVQFESAKRAASLNPMEPMVLSGDKSNIYSKKSLWDTAKNFMKDYGPSIGVGLGTFAGLSSAEPYSAGGGSSYAQTNANRQGVGGKGAAGGSFLSEAQRTFLNQQRSQLERVG